MKILRNIKKVKRELNCDLDIETISTNEKEKYNIKVIPTLMIDDKLILSGNVISERELTRILKPLLNP